MGTDERNSYRFAWRASRRRNCLTETTRTRFRRAILIKSRSRLRSSSLVTKYMRFATDRSFDDLVVIRIAAYLQFARCLHDCRPSRDQSNKCLCVPIGIPKPSDQSRSAENFCDFAEL